MNVIIGGLLGYCLGVVLRRLSYKEFFLTLFIIFLITLNTHIVLAQEPEQEYAQDLSPELSLEEMTFIDTLDKELLDSEDLGPVESDKKDTFKEVYFE